MVVEIWQTGSGFSFCRPPGDGAETLLIEAPAGSQLLAVASMGPRLFVPGPDRLVRLGHGAGDVVRGLRAGRFRSV